MVTRFLSNARVKAAAVAGSNMLAAMAILAVPPLLGVPAKHVLALSIALVSLQAGQAAAVQTRSTVRLSGPSIALLTTPILFLGALFSVEFAHISVSLSGMAMIGIAGLAVGAYIGGSATSFLDAGNPVGYQGFILKRNLVWLGVVLTCSFLMPDYLAYSIPVAWIIFILSNSSVGTRSSSIYPLVLGCITGVIYRNDVNIVRGMASANEFTGWHYFLIVYATVQALLGFLVVNEIYSRRGRVAMLCTSARVRIFAISVIVLAALAGTSVTLLQSKTQMLTVWAIILILGIVVSTQASVAHVLNASSWVYVGGTGGFILLVLLAIGGSNPEVALACELVLSSCTVAVVLLMRTFKGFDQASNKLSISDVKG